MSALTELIWNASAAGSYATATNFQKINIRDSNYSWTVSASGTNEYYLRTAGGGDPGLSEPANVYEDGDTTPNALSVGTAGSLSAGQWDWADNDTLGYSTVYVCLTDDGPDPDSEPNGFVVFDRVPVASDNVSFISNAQSVNAGKDASGVTLSRLDIYDSFTGKLPLTGEFHTDATTVEINRPGGIGTLTGSSRVVLDLGTVQTDVTVWGTSSTSSDTGREPVRLRGTNASNAATVHKGTVGLGTNNPGDAAEFSLTQYGGTVNGGDGLLLNDTVVDGSDAVLNIRNGMESGTTIRLINGTVNSRGASHAVPTVDQEGGTYNDYNAGTITTYTLGDGATLNVNSGAKTYTTMNGYGGTLDLTNAEGNITISTFNVLSDSLTIIDPNNRLPTNTDFVFGTGVKSFSYEHGGGVTLRRQA